MQTIVAAARVSFAKPFFMEVIMVACWNICLLGMGSFLEERGPLSLGGEGSSSMIFLYFSIESKQNISRLC
jgi:hypothetical protein